METILSQPNIIGRSDRAGKRMALRVAAIEGDGMGGEVAWARPDTAASAGRLAVAIPDGLSAQGALRTPADG
jgi:hypothetical protein